MLTLWLVGGILCVGGLFFAGVFVGQLAATEEVHRMARELQLAQNALPEVTLEVIVRENHRHSMRRFHSLEGEKAVHALRRAARLETFSYRDMAAILTRSEWEGFRDELIAARFLEWAGDSKRQGTRWPARGRALLRAARA